MTWQELSFHGEFQDETMLTLVEEIRLSVYIVFEVVNIPIYVLKSEHLGLLKKPKVYTRRRTNARSKVKAIMDVKKR